MERFKSGNRNTRSYKETRPKSSRSGSAADSTSERRTNSDRPYSREQRPERRTNSDRPYSREQRPERRTNSDRPYSREQRPERRTNSDRPYSREQRPERRTNSDRPYSREQRPERRTNSDRPYSREQRPERRYGENSYREERPYRSSERDFKRRDGGKGGFGRDKHVKERPKKVSTNLDKDPNVVRLNKFIANSGICSRREADEYIKSGLVSVNGVIVTELGVKINVSDDIRFNGERLKGEKKVYIIMNKPKDFVTTTSDPHAEKSVMDLISDKCPERVYPVGRLDKSTTGVLLFTNDGELAETLTHPSFKKKKIYHVFLDKKLKKTDFNKILSGIELEDGMISADSLSYIDEDESQVGLEIHSGRNRIVRRIFEHLGYKVKKLDRVYFAGMTKKNLRRGSWRYLDENEIIMLKTGKYE